MVEHKDFWFPKDSVALREHRGSIGNEAIYSTGADFIDKNPNKTRMKGGIQDPNFNLSEHYKNNTKVENQDSAFVYDYFKGQIREEKQDPNFLNQDHNKNKIQDENQDPEQRNNDPAASTNHQVSVDEFIFKNGFIMRLKAQGSVLRVCISPVHSGFGSSLEKVQNFV